MDAAAVEKYRKAGSIAGRARDLGASLLKPGALALDVANAVEEFVRKEGGEPAFPCNLSINENAAHYTPTVADPLTFKEGDVVKLDIGAHVDGYIGDTAITVEVGTDKHRDLVDASIAALDAALARVTAGVEIRDIGQAIEEAIRSRGLQPIVNLTGHSVDHYHQHAGLSIPNVAATARGRIEAGTAVAIEPFATRGLGKVKDSGPGHIYHFQRARPQRDPHAKAALKHIQEHYAELPFAERWVAGAIPDNKVAYAMRLLERSGAIRQYPVLREVSDGLVSQREHTVVVLEDEVLVTTRVD